MFVVSSLLCFLGGFCSLHCPGPAAHQCRDTYLRHLKAVGLEPAQATSFLLNVYPASPTNLQFLQLSFISLHHSTLDKSVGFVMLGLVFLSVRTCLLSALDRPSCKHCCQSNEPAASISLNPCLSANSSKSAAPAHERESPGTMGHHGPLTSDWMQGTALQHHLEDEQLLRWGLHATVCGRRPWLPIQ